jgi:DNA-binding transcriptional MocR family regulator
MTFSASAPVERGSRGGRAAVEIRTPHREDGPVDAADAANGAIATKDFPALSWKRAYLAALMSPPSRLYYAPPEGDAALRRALQGYLGRQQAIDLCARVLLDADDTFVFEDPATWWHGAASRPPARGCCSSRWTPMAWTPSAFPGMQAFAWPT